MTFPHETPLSSRYPDLQDVPGWDQTSGPASPRRSDRRGGVQSRRARLWHFGVLGAAILILALWVAGVGSAGAAANYDAYVVSLNSNDVTPVNTATNTAGPAIAVGNHPYAIAIAPDGNEAYVVNEGSNTVTPIDLSDSTPGTPIPVGNQPTAIAITPDGTTAYVTNYGANTVTPIDLATNTSGPAITVGNGPWDLAVNARRQHCLRRRPGRATRSSRSTWPRMWAGTAISVGNQPGSDRTHPRWLDRVCSQLQLEQRNSDRVGDQHQRAVDPGGQPTGRAWHHPRRHNRVRRQLRQQHRHPDHGRNQHDRTNDRSRPGTRVDLHNARRQDRVRRRLQLELAHADQRGHKRAGYGGSSREWTIRSGDHSGPGARRVVQRYPGRASFIDRVRRLGFDRRIRHDHELSLGLWRRKQRRHLVADDDPHILHERYVHGDAD